MIRDTNLPGGRENKAVAAALLAFLVAVIVDIDFFTVGGGGGGEETCPYEPFYSEGELPMVHEIDLQVGKEAFSAMVGRMWDRNQPELPMNISFNGALQVDAKVQLHGGPFQRGKKPGADAGSCHGGGTGEQPVGWNRDGADDGLPKCKPGFRLNFNKRSKLRNSPRLWGHPAGLADCTPPDKVVLRSEWNDGAMMVRNKLSTDLYQKMGSPVVRVEYARVSVDGTYWGLFTLEEHLDTDFLKCRGLPHDDPGTALYKPFPDMLPRNEGWTQDVAGHTGWSVAGCENDPSLCTLPFERKLPKCDGCDSGDAFTTKPFLGDQPPECYVQDTAALNASCPKPADLHELFYAVSKVNDPGSEEERATAKLLQVLNVSSYMVWQMVTVFNADCDHGNRNYCECSKRPGLAVVVPSTLREGSRERGGEGRERREGRRHDQSEGREGAEAGGI